MPVPVPPENPLTGQKIILGKILFWDEQLSSDNTVACGTCHRPGSGGSDPRQGLNPGVDGRFETADDIVGSPGIAALDEGGNPIAHAAYGFGAQVTERAAPSYLTGMWSDAVFWDGRADGEFLDPLTGEVVIPRGGSLEQQALQPIMNSTEMAKRGREWDDVIAKLERVEPLALATDLPRDVETHLSAYPDYPSLFAAAFGDAVVTPVRIAFAIASYERTLIADETPWDVANRENKRLPPAQHLGSLFFETLGCAECHVPPLFTNNEFFNIGIRGGPDDRGRENVTANPDHRGAVKVPSLRNVALRRTFMHTGDFTTIAQVVDAYADVPFPALADDLPSGKKYNFNMTEAQRTSIIEFLTHSLTDPRVENETFPFDRPMLRSERGSENRRPLAAPAALAAHAEGNGVRLTWDGTANGEAVVDYRLNRDGVVLAWTTRNGFMDDEVKAGRTYLYSLQARDAQANASPAATLAVRTPGWPVGLGWVMSLALAGCAALAVPVARRRIEAYSHSHRD